ncbi:GNVR domain-containing protein [Sphingomonas sp. BAUL-RG-20F-R05-02]|uniref:GNVR domain-containing protein n=1 Tax=Sphingomonas sp. BAUL-RG-20F-R05-02 TaxID=2914830 RepID=UPI001F58DA10|nr:GNVR domain-containing protein [Sphingomonas sp. BAUL-RG-20F-R05-02]
MMPLSDLIAALKMRWRLELFIIVAVLALVALWTSMSPKTYVATATLLFDEPTVDPVQGTQTTAQDSIVGLLSTQSDVIGSVAVASTVVRSLQLASPDIVARWQAATGGTGDINAWYGRQLLSNLEIVPDKGSRVLTLQYSSTNPQFASVLANAFAVSYLDTRLKLRTDPARTYSRWFQDRTREVRENLQQAQARLTEFKRKTGIVDTGTSNAEVARLSELSNQLTSAEASAASLNARAGSNAAESPDVQSSGVVQGLRAQIAGKAAQISQMSTSLGPNHPDLIAAKAELSELRSKLASEIGTSTRSVHVASNAATNTEADLRNKLNAQRGRMLSLSTDNAQLDVLQRDVDTAKAAYDAVAARLQTMRLQSVAPETNVRQLDTATPPLLPAKPNVPLRLLLAAVLGGMLAVGAGLALEVWRPRVRTADGISEISGVPVLAILDLSSSRAGTLLTGTAL